MLKKYEFITYKGHTYTTVDYKAWTTYNDSIIQTQDNSFHKIIEIYKNNYQCLLHTVQLKVRPLVVGSIIMKNTWVLEGEDSKHILAPENILCKINLISVEEKSYLCKLPTVNDLD